MNQFLNDGKIEPLIPIYNSLTPEQKMGIAQNIKSLIGGTFSGGGFNIGFGTGGFGQMKSSPSSDNKNLIKRKYTRKQLVKMLKQKYSDIDHLSHDDLAWMLHMSNL